jgi:hypothetical protein
MRDWYDHISEHDAIEEQAQVLPYGPIGTLLRPDIKVEGDLPTEAKDLYSRFFKNEIGELELAKKLGELKRKMNEADDVLKP